MVSFLILFGIDMDEEKTMYNKYNNLLLWVLLPQMLAESNYFPPTCLVKDTAANIVLSVSNNRGKTRPLTSFSYTYYFYSSQSGSGDWILWVWVIEWMIWNTFWGIYFSLGDLIFCKEVKIKWRGMMSVLGGVFGYILGES